MDKNHAKTIFNTIFEIVTNSKVFKENDQEKDILIINIYLTALGVRNACIPDFTNDVLFSKKVEKLMNSLNEISELKLVFGPYYDTGNHYVICCKANFSKTKLILTKLEKYQDVPNKSQIGEVHILMGKLLGYTCAINVMDYLNKRVYGVVYEINDIKFLGYWCPVENGVGDKEFEFLNNISLAIKLLDLNMVAELIVDTRFA